MSANAESGRQGSLKLCSTFYKRITIFISRHILEISSNNLNRLQTKFLVSSPEFNALSRMRPLLEVLRQIGNVSSDNRFYYYLEIFVRTVCWIKFNPIYPAQLLNYYALFLSTFECGQWSFSKMKFLPIYALCKLTISLSAGIIWCILLCNANIALEFIFDVEIGTKKKMNLLNFLFFFI